MIVDDINLAYPYLNYKVRISHYSSRKPSVIEWLILEAINKASSLPEYSEMSVAMLFEQVFTITDSNLLIKPCLFSLYDIDAITLGEISDETDLSNVPMKNLSLTKVGSELQSKGLIPGKQQEDITEMCYDIVEKRIFDSYAAGLSNQPKGTEVCEVTDSEEFVFPAAEAQMLVEEAKNGKVKLSNIKLKPDTVVSSITPGIANVRWRNIVKKLCLTENLYCYIDEIEDEQICNKVLAKMKPAREDKYGVLPLLSVKDPDKELLAIHSIKKVGDIVVEHISKDSFALIDDVVYKYDSVMQNIKSGTTWVTSGAEEFSLNFAKQKNIVRIPENILKQGEVYRNNNINIGKYNMELKTNSASEVLPFVCERQNEEDSLLNTVIKIVDAFYEKDEKIVFILKEAGFEEAFFEYIKKLISAKSSMKEKAAFAEKINRVSISLYNKISISSKLMEELLIDVSQWEGQKLSIENIYDIIAECWDITLFKQQPDIVKSLFKNLFSRINDDLSLETVWKFLRKLKSLREHFIKLVCSDGLYHNLYQEEVISQLLEKFMDEELFENDEFTFVEQVVFAMRRIVEQLKNFLPEIDFSKNYDDKFIEEQVIKNKQHLRNIYDCLERWENEKERFNSKIGEYNFYFSRTKQLTEILENINKLSDAMKLFFNDSIRNYEKIVIVDTCALMHMPEIISCFENGKTMLIIPQIVLGELDKLKVSEDEEKSEAAIEAIRVINNHRAYEWLNLKEESCTHLLSKDLDENNNDNKILSIAVKYIMKTPLLLTDDINLKNIASSQNVEVMGVSAYKNKIEHEILTASTLKKKEKKKHSKKKR